MKKLLEAINRGILKGLNESNINLLTDLDDIEPDQLDSLQTKSVNNTIDISAVYINQFKNMVNDACKRYVIIPLQLPDALVKFINDPINYEITNALIPAHNIYQIHRLITLCREALGEDGNFNWIDTRNITDMSNLFEFDRIFNGHIELWDTSNVENMSYMFAWATSFNNPIKYWDVSNVKMMNGMFRYAESFNQDISTWDVSNVGCHFDPFEGCRIEEEYKPNFN